MRIIEGTDLYLFWCEGCACCHYINKSWQFNGDCENPTVSPSILVNKDQDCPSVPRCHFFIENGYIRYLSDCTHSLANQTIKMKEL